jgi:hypothetical protein
MSSDRPLPPDRDDDVEDAAVSRAWAANKSVQPPSKLDDAVLKFARDAQMPVRARRRWQAPMALAAVLTLGLGVVLQLWREPQVRAPQPQTAAPVAAAPAPMPVSVPDTAPAADEMRDAQTAAVESRQREAVAKRSESSASRKREAAAAAAEMQRRAERERRAESFEIAPSAPPPPSPPAAVFAEEDSASPVMSAPAPPAEASAGVMPPQSKALAAAPPVMAMRAYAPTTRPQPMQPAVAIAWQSARFYGVPLRTTTREQLQQRYGKPSSTPTSRTDRYESLPEVQGATEFEYDAQSRLMYVRQQPTPLLAASEWAAQRNWPEPPLQRDADWRCAGSSGPGATAAGNAIWVYPTRGAWLVLDAEQRVVQVNYAAACE